MGVPVRRSNKHKSKGKSNKKKVATMTAQEYFIRAEVACMGEDYAAAQQLFVKCLELEPENAQFLDGYGAFLAEYGGRQDAIPVLQKACAASPEDGFEKFMYLGQVLDAEDCPVEAEDAMRRGIVILRRDLSLLPGLGEDSSDTGEKESAEIERLQENLSSALCSLAELLMGMIHDALDEADDEESVLSSSQAIECEQLLTEARQLWPSSPEPLQALCSLRVMQGREEEALQLLHQSLVLWHVTAPAEEPEDVTARGNTEDQSLPPQGDEIVGINHDANIPSYEFRFETAKLLLELEETTFTAAEVLEGLLEENDSVPDVWLLLAVAYRAGGELESAAEAAVNGASLARKQGLSEDHEVVAALEELEKELQPHLSQG